MDGWGGRWLRTRIALVLCLILLCVMLLPAPPAAEAGLKEAAAGVVDAVKDKLTGGDKGNVFEQILAGIIEFPLRMAEWVLTAGGFQSISDLVFLEGSNRDYQPWRSEAQMTDVRTWFFALTAVALPFMVFAIASTAFKLFYAATNPAARAEAQESMLRWLGAAVMIAMAPVLVYTMLWLSQIMVDGIKLAFQTVITDADRSVGWWGIDFAGLDISTGSVLGTAFVKVAFFLMFIYLNVLYLVRMVAISVMFIFTPFVAVMWAINKNVNAVGIWFGELASNAFMPVAHAIVLCTILILSDVSTLGEDGSGSWLQVLILMYTLIPLSEMLRNSMQSLLTRMSGLAEESAASKATLGLIGLGGLVGIARVGAAAMQRPAVPPIDRPSGLGRPLKPYRTSSEMPPRYQQQGGHPSAYPGTHYGYAKAKEAPASGGNLWDRGRKPAQTVGRWTEKGAQALFMPVAGAVPGGREAAGAMGRIAGKGAQYTAQGIHAGAEVVRRVRSGEKVGDVVREAASPITTIAKPVTGRKLYHPSPDSRLDSFRRHR